MTSKSIRKAGTRIVVLAITLLMMMGLYVAETPRAYSQTCGNVPFDQWISGKTTSYTRARQYAFYGTARSRVSIWMEQGDYSSIDPYLQLADPYGNIVAYDNNSAGNRNSWIDRQYLRRSGCYTIIARSYNNRTYGSFWLYVSEY